MMGWKENLSSNHVTICSTEKNCINGGKKFNQKRPVDDNDTDRKKNYPEIETIFQLVEILFGSFF